MQKYNFFYFPPNFFIRNLLKFNCVGTHLQSIAYSFLFFPKSPLKYYL